MTETPRLFLRGADKCDIMCFKLSDRFLRFAETCRRKRRLIEWQANYMALASGRGIRSLLL